MWFLLITKTKRSQHSRCFRFLNVYIPWLAVGLTWSFATVTLNIISIIVFIKNRNLRKRSMYLVLNLAVADMLVGGIATYDLFYMVGEDCYVWKYNVFDYWPSYAVFVFLLLFLASSLTNIKAISVERLYGKLRPFRHRVINKSVYVFMIGIVWVTAGLLAIVLTVLLKLKFLLLEFL